MPPSNGFESLSRISGILNALSSCSSAADARSMCPEFPNLAEHIAQLFMDDRLFDVLPRLQVQQDMVKRWQPPVRPALDPYISTQIGVFSKNFEDSETGHFLDYPDCCIRSFSERIRYALDEQHEHELAELGSRGGTKPYFVTISGFVPCSVLCEESHRRRLIAFADDAQVRTMRSLEVEIARSLPHFHSEYQGRYYEIRSILSR